MIKRITNKNLTLAEFEYEINSTGDDSIVCLETDLEFELENDGFFVVGANGIRSLITIRRRDIMIDGQGQKITVRCRRTERNNTAVFRLDGEARGAEIRNLTLNFEYLGEDTNRTFIGILNTAYGAKVNHCKIVLNSEKRINMTAVSARVGVDMQSETRADNFAIENNDIRVYCKPEAVTGSMRQCGIENLFTNSLSVSNNYILAVVKGSGEKQQAVGIFNNGRYARIVNNNIKTNADHSKGIEVNQAHVCGFENEGEFLIFSANNCVGEWAGKALGVYNKANHAAFHGNKILATHTIHGIPLRNEGYFCTVSANMLISTSRNARLLENQASGVSVVGNILEVLFFTDQCQSGFGMVFTDSTNCVAVGNQIIGVKNCGIFSRNSIVLRENNFINFPSAWSGFREYATEENGVIAEAIAESNIHSVTEEEE